MQKSNIKRTIRVSKRSGGGRWIKTKAEKEEEKAQKARQELANQRATQFELDRAKLGEQGLALSVMGTLQQKQKVVATGGSRVSKSKKRSGGGKRKAKSDRYRTCSIESQFWRTCFVRYSSLPSSH